MNARLRIALLLTLAATLGTALWPEGEAVTAALAPAQRRGVDAGQTERPPGSVTPGPDRAVAAIGDAHTAAGPSPIEPATTAVAVAADRPPERDWPVLAPAGRQAWQARPVPDAPRPDAPAATTRAGRTPPPPAASAPAEAAPRQAPPLPYQWVGVYDDGPSPQALLAGRVRSVNVRVGQIVDRDWRLEAIASGRLDWTWLPGNLPVTQRAGLQAAPLTSDLP